MVDILWSPWRIKYIQGRKKKGCIFCNAIKGRYRNYVVVRNAFSFSMLNTYPYNNGHIMVSPNRHIRSLESLKDAEVLDLFKTLIQTKMLLNKVLKPHGYNIGININTAAGAGIVSHLHIHLVPRWKADTNFMPVTSNTKIISQSLADLYTRLKNVKSKTD